MIRRDGEREHVGERESEVLILRVFCDDRGELWR